ncbi:hypothetical protein D3C86_1012320 [compost metagenome]
MYFRCSRQDVPGRPVSGIQVAPSSHAGGPGRADRTHPPGGAGAGLAGAGDRRGRGRRRDRHAGQTRGRTRRAHHRLHRRQGPGAARQQPCHPGQHHDRRGAGRARRRQQIRGAARPHRGLPDAGGRHRGQRARRDQGGPQDGRQMDYGIWLRRQADRGGRWGQGRGRQQPARSHSEFSVDPPAPDRQVRLRPDRPCGRRGRPDAAPARRRDADRTV